MDRLRPAPQVVTLPVVVPAECRVDPIEPRPTDEPTLLPENVQSPVEANRAQLANARLAFLFWQDRASALEEAYDVNASTQRHCAAWARSQDQ
jgi:hypothetical protein